MFVGVGAARVRDMFEQAKKTRLASSSLTRSTRFGRQRGAGWEEGTMSGVKP